MIVYLGLLLSFASQEACQVSNLEAALDHLLQSHHLPEFLEPTFPNITEQRHLLELEENGGAGRVVKMTSLEDNPSGDGYRLIEIISPPRSGRFPTALPEIHKKLVGTGVPILVDYDRSISAFERASGMMVHTNSFKPEFQGAIILPSFGADNISLRHEFQHVLDYALNPRAFLTGLPKMPKSVLALIEKSVQNQKTTKLEGKRLASLPSFLQHALEKRASGQTLRSLFTKRGFTEIVLDKNRKQQIETYLNEIKNYREHLRGMAYHGLWVSPANPKILFLALQSATGDLLTLSIQVGTGLVAGSMLFKSWEYLSSSN